MAKSVRSKWKKQQRRERTRDEEENTRKRISQLHGKLRLTVRGGISSVAPQAPEKRFHFLNPELDPRVPNPRKNLNNNYRAELNNVSYDFSKPLRLPPSKTNYHGKSDTTTPHTMTIHYETIDADAPIAGHALTKKDLERLGRRATAMDGVSSQNGRPANDAAEEDVDGGDEGPEEFVFGLEDGVACRVTKGASAASKKSASHSGPKSSRAKKNADAQGRQKTESSAGGAHAQISEESMEAVKPVKIRSMQNPMRRAQEVIAISGSRKMKSTGTSSSAASPRVVQSGSAAAARKTKKTKSS